jgi:hypothetical protein
MWPRRWRSARAEAEVDGGDDSKKGSSNNKSQGLKPRLLFVLIARAKARAYLRSNSKNKNKGNGKGKGKGKNNSNSNGKNNSNSKNNSQYSGPSLRSG